MTPMTHHCLACDLIAANPDRPCPCCGERAWEPLAGEPAILVPVPPILRIGPDSLLLVVGAIVPPAPDHWRWN